MAGKFEVYKDKAGEFRFRLKAGNGETIATGESYPEKKACLKGIESIKKNAPTAAIVDLTEDAAAKPKTAAKLKADAKPKAPAKPKAAKPKA